MYSTVTDGRAPGRILELDVLEGHLKCALVSLEKVRQEIHQGASRGDGPALPPEKRLQVALEHFLDDLADKLAARQAT